jgi:putative flippase GtrA
VIEVSEARSTLAVEAIRRPSRRGRHRKSNLVSRMVSQHSKRLTSFSLIGFGVFALGVGFQAVLVREAHMPKEAAYITQLLLSIQLNFWANYRWTWNDRNAPFWRSCFRYNLKRAAGTLLSLALYPLLVKLGMNYLVANALLVILLTPANYVLGHWWTFASRAEPLRQDLPDGYSNLDWDPALDAGAPVGSRLVAAYETDSFYGSHS